MTPKAQGKFLICVPYVKPEPSDKPKLIIPNKSSGDEKIYTVVSSVNPDYLNAHVVSAGYPYPFSCNDVIYYVIKEEEVAAIIS